METRLEIRPGRGPGTEKGGSDEVERKLVLLPNKLLYPRFEDGKRGKGTWMVLHHSAVPRLCAMHRELCLLIDRVFGGGVVEVITIGDSTYWV
jgi:hypothetical protein